MKKKTTSSLLIPKIRFRLIKCHCWKGASSDLTIVSQRVATASTGSSEKVREREDECMEKERGGWMYSGMWRDGKEENWGEREKQGDGWWEGWRGVERKSETERDLPTCGIIIQCVSVWLGKDIIKETWGRLGSRSRGGSATLPPLLPLNLYNLPLFESLLKRACLTPNVEESKSCV